MGYKNIKGILLDATKYPATIEAALPAGAPKISTMLTDAANQIPAMPDLPIEIPVLPDAPALPALPGMPTLPGGTTNVNGGTVYARKPQRFVSGVEVVPLQGTKQVFGARPNGWPAQGVTEEIVTRRGI